MTQHSLAPLFAPRDETTLSLENTEEVTELIAA